MDYIDKNKDHTAALIKEHMRVNDRNTRKSTVRMLQQTGEVDDTITSEAYLEESDVDVKILDADFSDLSGEQ